MNGRSITSCGINPARWTTGTVTREPCGRWHYRQAGVVPKRDGIESRSFYFATAAGAMTAAKDGGLIELHVFRAKSRRRAAPKLGQYRGQERYGIASLSEGLLECPEKASHYEWILIDPSDSPFASLLSYYHAWAHICELDLSLDDAPLPAAETGRASHAGGVEYNDMQPRGGGSRGQRRGILLLLGSRKLRQWRWHQQIPWNHMRRPSQHYYNRVPAGTCTT
ncbi:hypothetical protein TOPH_06795 [Tolypocladium ophioglossoides CBS 100239]|uniref:Uncharacterized protein n=1 Tax=Tolypocladium ophioglossoides (strain CBS 100239) TaxID=1163406 RepID=A0A0L0N375_TOLOC|nr:hypothetical protein TOPH_06795 [Tolypocladium ophioglossoides CBS 100239]